MGVLLTYRYIPLYYLQYLVFTSNTHFVSFGRHWVKERGGLEGKNKVLFPLSPLLLVFTAKTCQERRKKKKGGTEGHAFAFAFPARNGLIHGDQGFQSKFQGTNTTISCQLGHCNLE